jgi:hypothetical protein
MAVRGILRIQCHENAQSLNKDWRARFVSTLNKSKLRAPPLVVHGDNYGIRLDTRLRRLWANACFLRMACRGWVSKHLERRGVRVENGDRVARLPRIFLAILI